MDTAAAGRRVVVVGRRTGGRAGRPPQLLVAPIQRLLPAERGSLLTILPHGPLFRLSFAALRNPTGQYLVERYAIHYVPAGVVLGLAEQHARASEPGDRTYLLIADPQTPLRCQAASRCHGCRARAGKSARSRRSCRQQRRHRSSARTPQSTACVRLPATAACCTSRHTA